MNDPKLRVNAMILAAESGLRAPLLVRESWGVLALAVIVGIIPSIVISLAAFELLQTKMAGTFLEPLTPIPHIFQCTVAFIAIFLPSVMLIYFQSGKFTWCVAKHLADQGRLLDAETVLLGLDHTVSTIHLLLYPELLRFVRKHGLATKSNRYNSRILNTSKETVDKFD